MRFRKRFISDVRERLTGLGLRSCPVCTSATLSYSPWPALVPVKGAPWPSRPRDREAAVMYAVAVRCDACGHLLLFDSETHRRGTESPMITSLSDAEEDEADATP